MQTLGQYARYTEVGHCRDILQSGIAGIVYSGASQGYFEVGHCRNYSAVGHCAEGEET